MGSYCNECKAPIWHGLVWCSNDCRRVFDARLRLQARLDTTRPYQMSECWQCGDLYIVPSNQRDVCINCKLADDRQAKIQRAR